MHIVDKRGDNALSRCSYVLHLYFRHVSLCLFLPGFSFFKGVLPGPPETLAPVPIGYFIGAPVTRGA
jgi:hypothetical protein